MSSKIVLLTGNHLCNNPRVIKEASTLARAGHQVWVLGAWADGGLKQRDLELAARLPFNFVPVLDLTGLTPTVRRRRLMRRAVSGSARLVHRLLGIESRYQLGHTVGALTRAAQTLQGDLFIAHSEAALFAARTLSDSGERIAIDMEDWFSEDLPPQARRSRPLLLLRSLERVLLRSAVCSTCTSHAMSVALARTYKCSPPTVIYNAFSWVDRRSLDGHLKDRRDRSRPSIHWYSQTLGDGRGLEELMVALSSVHYEAELHLRGVPAAGFTAWLAQRTPEQWRNCIFVHPPVTNGELLSRISEHDIGFAGEMKYCRNKELTVSNKMLHYLLAGLAVVASDTTGQREVAGQATGAVFLYPSGDAGALASQLNALLEAPDRLEGAKAAGLRAARQTFCWERMEGRLLNAVGTALGVGR